MVRLEARDVPNGYLALGAGPGGLPQVAIRVDIQDAVAGSLPNAAGQPAVPFSDGKTEFTSQVLMAYNPAFRGGVNVATGNFDGDYGTPDMLVTAPKAGGGPHVIVWNTQQSTDGTIVVTGIRAQFMAFDPRFTGGVNITCGDLDGDGKAELICAAGPGGGPHVKIYTTDAAGNFVLATQFYAYDAGFRGGVSLASGQGYTTPVLVEQPFTGLPQTFTTTTYPTGSPIPGANIGQPLLGFDPFVGPYFAVGGGQLQYLSGNLLNSYGQIAYRPDIVPLPGDTTTGRLVFATWADTTATSNYPTDGSAPPTAIPVGPYVQVGTVGSTPVITRLTPGPVQTQPRNQLVTGAGPGGGPHVRVFSFTGSGTGMQANLGKEFYAFDPSFRGGINVAINDVISSPFPDPTTFTVRPGTNPTGVSGFNPRTFEIETTEIAGTRPMYPYNTDELRRYQPEIVVGMASGGSLVHVFSDYNPAVPDPFNPFSDNAPSVRATVADLNPALTRTEAKLFPDPNNALGDPFLIHGDLNERGGGFFSWGSTVEFDRAIDPQSTGGVVPAWSAFTFDGSANTINTIANGLTIVDPSLAQSVFANGTGAQSPSRGSTVRIFNQMSTIPQVSPNTSGTHNLSFFYNPVDQFSAFSQFSGVGLSASFGFGVLPTPSLDLVRLPGTAVTTVTNPILV